jgi:predicted Fe-S protein YdhL (DUF1289 family)
MLNKLLLLILLISVILSLGCKKDFSERQCQHLKDEMIADNKQEVIKLLNEKVSQLPSTTYTKENLNKLAASISDECGITTQVLCFGCIQTLPEQSEIRFSFTQAGTTTAKTIDISYTSNNQIKIVSMHD